MIATAYEKERQQQEAKNKQKTSRPKLAPRPQQNLFSRPQSPAKQEILHPAEHYKKIKERYSNALLIIREGDSYTALGEDAKSISKILELATVIENETEKTSFPVSDLDANLIKMIKAGRPPQHF